jgi:signal transduction histidine kinase
LRLPHHHRIEGLALAVAIEERCEESGFREVGVRINTRGTKDRRGLGLGLYIAKSIIDVHGGRIWVASRKGGGSSFHFTLPVVQPTTT